MFHLPKSFSGTNCALYPLQGEMTLQWIPPLSQGLTLYLTHPLGVLHFSAMELVLLSHSPDELQHTTCGIVKMTEFWGEAITVRVMVPLQAHVTSYIVTLHTHPPNRERELHTPPQQTPPSRETLHYLQVELGDLADHELHQLVDDLMQEIAQCEIHVLPAIPLKMNGYTHWAVKSPRRTTRRSPFLEEEGGVHRGNPLHLQSQIDQLEIAFPLDHPCECHAPTPSGSDMGQLITALTLGLSLGTPKINIFSGNFTPGKTEVLFMQWNHEVQCI